MHISHSASFGQIILDFDDWQSICGWERKREPGERGVAHVFVGLREGLDGHQVVEVQVTKQDLYSAVLFRGHVI